MEDPGQKLRRVRERLNLRVRDVELASQKIADKYHNDEFAVLINRVSEIENQRAGSDTLQAVFIVRHLSFGFS